MREKSGHGGTITMSALVSSEVRDDVGAKVCQMPPIASYLSPIGSD
jgi:hypothetical protein